MICESNNRRFNGFLEKKQPDGTWLGLGPIILRDGVTVDEIELAYNIQPGYFYPLPHDISETTRCLFPEFRDEDHNGTPCVEWGRIEGRCFRHTFSVEKGNCYFHHTFSRSSTNNYDDFRLFIWVV